MAFGKTQKKRFSKNILEMGSFVETSKVNLEMILVLFEIAKKRDGHFIIFQNFVCSLSVLDVIISMILNDPKDSTDQKKITFIMLVN